MSYISEIFDRLELQQIREFLINGLECTEISAKTCEERLKEAEKLLFKTIQEKLPPVDEYNQITGDIHDYAKVIRDIYMEIGMQCGAVLMMKLLKHKN